MAATVPLVGSLARPLGALALAGGAGAPLVGRYALVGMAPGWGTLVGRVGGREASGGQTLACLVGPGVALVGSELRWKFPQ